LEEEPTRALASEARGLAEEEEESPQAAAPETRSRIAMAHRCSSHSSATVSGGCFDGFVWCGVFFPSSATLVGCALLLSLSSCYASSHFLFYSFFNFYKLG